MSSTQLSTDLWCYPLSYPLKWTVDEVIPLPRHRRRFVRRSFVRLFVHSSLRHQHSVVVLHDPFFPASLPAGVGWLVGWLLAAAAKVATPTEQCFRRNLNT